jgi:hypothetical protein
LQLESLHYVFRMRANSALVVSVGVDALDYLAPMLSAMQILGDISDGIAIGILYEITRSKRSILLNLVEFIPVIGDFVPAYTISRLLWIYSESRQKQKQAIIQ